MQENKKLVWWVVVIIIALVVIAFLVYYMRSYPQGEVPQTAQPDSVSAIESDLQSLKLDDLTSELSDIDKELAQ